MKTIIAVALASWVTTSVFGQTTDEKRRADVRARSERIAAIEKRVTETKPQRRDSPLRDINITDDEVREIQRVTSGIWPKAILNISGVVTGCPCEEGPACSDQVWVSTDEGGNTIGIQLSRIDSRWKIGVIQTWWFEYDRLRASGAKRRSYWEFSAEHASIIEKFPMCRISA